MLQIFILSLIQGLTEFLPISSSGHLILLPRLMNWPDHDKALDISLHFGTLLAVLIYFFPLFWNLALNGSKGLRERKLNPELRLILHMIIATIPAIILGIIVTQIGFPKSTWIIAITSIIFGIFLYFSDRFMPNVRSLEEMNFKHSLYIGCAQAIALIPGSSRSGTCITMARLLGFKKDVAIKFAFIISVPTILGAVILMLPKLQHIALDTLFLGVSLSMIFGLLSIHLMLKFVERIGFLPFAIYRLVLGCGLLYLF